MENNPIEGIESYAVNNEKERVLSDQEMDRLLQAIRESRASDHLLPIIQMLALTGARKREVLDARWQDIDLDKRRWTLHENKSGKTQYKVLSGAVIELLKEQALRSHPDLSNAQPAPGEDWIFPSPVTGRPFVGIHHSWGTARKKAGLSDVRIHDLRHNFASQLVNKGRSLYEVQTLLGHRNAKITQRYAHFSNERLVDAASMMTLPGIDKAQQHQDTAFLKSLPQKAANDLRAVGWSEEDVDTLLQQLQSVA